jgi:hypothetical protein
MSSPGQIAPSLSIPDGMQMRSQIYSARSPIEFEPGPEIEANGYHSIEKLASGKQNWAKERTAFAQNWTEEHKAFATTICVIPVPLQ